MATVKQVLDMARSQLGVKESPAGSNRQKFGLWYRMNGVAWCAIFVSWVFGHVAKGLDICFGKNSYTPTWAKKWYNAKQWSYNKPRPGAVVFFHFGEKAPGRWLGIVHVGLVESVRKDGYIITLEGNTSAGSNANGGQVQRRVRSPKMIAGYGYPKYDKEPVVKPPVIVIPKPKNCHTPNTAPVLRNGSHGVWVKHLQRDLNEARAKTSAVKRLLYGWKILALDKDFGDKTEKAVKAAQRNFKLSRDGVCGKDTWTKLI